MKLYLMIKYRPTMRPNNSGSFKTNLIEDILNYPCPE